jgi:hypothetical protein
VAGKLVAQSWAATMAGGLMGSFMAATVADKSGHIFFCDTFKSLRGRRGSFGGSQKITDLNKARGGSHGSTIGITNLL